MKVGRAITVLRCESTRTSSSGAGVRPRGLLAATPTKPCVNSAYMSCASSCFAVQIEQRMPGDVTALEQRLKQECGIITVVRKVLNSGHSARVTPVASSNSRYEGY